MKQKKLIQIITISLCLLFILATPTSSSANQANIISDFNFLTAEKNYYSEAIENTLTELESPLSEHREQVGENNLTAADSIWAGSQHLDFGLNPKVIIINLLLEGVLDHSYQEKFTPMVQVMAEELWQYYSEGLGGEQKITLKNDQEIEIFGNCNPATFAIAKYYAPQFESEVELYDYLQKWRVAWQNTFDFDPSIELYQVKSAPDIEPFLRLPFEQPEGAFIRVNSFFDHAVPGVYDDSILRFDGLTIGNAGFTPCTIGVNCYGGHNGIDYKTGAGRAILAPADGVVSYKYFNTDENAGRVDSGLYIDHGNGYRTAYWHMDPILVEAGETIVAGQVIGLSGNIGMSSGPHLHFGLRMIDGNKSVDPFGWWSSSVGDYWGDSNFMWQGDLIADNYEAQSQLFYVDYWWLEERGYGGDSYWTYGMTNTNNSTNWGLWGSYIDEPGQYKVYAYWPSGSENTNSAQYEIFHSGGSSKVTVDQSAAGDQFVLLGTYSFDHGDAAVLLRDLTNDSGKRLYFDAVKWEFVSSSNPTPSAPPAAPTLISPNGTIDTEDPLFVWYATANASKYWLTVGRSSDGAYLYNSYVIPYCNGYTCWMNLPDSLSDGDYWFKVTAGNASGWGDASSQMNFSVAASQPPAVPALISPTGTIDTNNPLFVWYTTANTTKYWLTVGRSSDGAYLYNSYVIPYCNGYTCWMNLPVSLSNGDYWFKVTAGNASGWGNASSQMNFSVAVSQTPSAPTLISPNGAGITNNPLFVWYTTANTTKYWLTVGRSSDGAYLFNSYVIPYSNGYTCWLNLPFFLSEGDYWFKVTAGNTSGWGNASAQMAFTVSVDSQSEYRIQPDNPFFIPNFAYPESGDNWLGVAGQVFDSEGNPVDHIVVVVEGTLGGEEIEEISLTSVNQAYGPGGYEIILGNSPIASNGTLFITLYDLNDTRLSTPFYFYTYADAQKNLILINFQGIE